MSEINTLNDTSFDEWIATNQGLILLHKKLCPHCKVMHSVVQKAVAAGFDASIAMLDVEENPVIRARYEADRVPMVLVARGGVVVASKNGIMNPTELRNFVESAC